VAVAVTLELVPVTFAEAAAFVGMHHRHNRPPIGHKFSIGVAVDDTLVGVAIAGRPVARHFDDGRTLEVNRTATDGTANANSKLLRRDGVVAAWRRVAHRRPAATPTGLERAVTTTSTDARRS
jgi:hypothetical protein